MAMVKVDPGQDYLWYYTDHLGSSRLVSGNDYSSNDQRRDYAPFGDPKTSSGNDESAYPFTQKNLTRIPDYSILEQDSKSAESTIYQLGIIAKWMNRFEIVLVSYH
jgi:hypothetical protein